MEVWAQQQSVAQWSDLKLVAALTLGELSGPGDLFGVLSGTSSIRLEVRLVEPSSAPAADLVIWKDEMEYTPELVQTLDEAISPVRDPQIDRLVDDSLKMRLTVRNDPLYQKEMPFVTVTRRVESAGSFEDIAVATRIDILVDEKVVATLDQPRAGDGDDRAVVFLDPSLRSEFFRDGAWLQDLPPTAKIRISGDGRFALRDLGRNRYWAGVIERPFATAVPNN